MQQFVVTLVALAAPFAWGSCAEGDASGSPSAYTLLDDSASQLREDFNHAKGSVRLLFVVDPICPGCLRGLDDVNKALLSTTRDPRLETFVVHVPVLGAEGKDVAPATKLLQNSRVHHYWNPSGTFGRQLSEGVGLKRGDESVYAWDVWLIYDPQTIWSGANPPKPLRLMHQLRALRGSKEFPPFNGEAFAQDVRQLLAHLPAPTSAR